MNVRSLGAQGLVRLVVQPKPTTVSSPGTGSVDEIEAGANGAALANRPTAMSLSLPNAPCANVRTTGMTAPFTNPSEPPDSMGALSMQCAAVRNVVGDSSTAV